AVQVAVAGQAVPQPPQFIGSSAMTLMQVPSQLGSPAGHAHSPVTHAKPGSHSMLQPPQCKGLLITSATQLCPHAVSPAAQLSVHIPPEQNNPAPQAMPQVPQFAASEFVSRQVPSQLVRPP